MGWVSGPRLTAATANAGGLGILASATMTYEELEDAILEDQAAARTSRSASTCAPTPPTHRSASTC